MSTLQTHQFEDFEAQFSEQGKQVLVFIPKDQHDYIKTNRMLKRDWMFHIALTVDGEVHLVDPFEARISHPSENKFFVGFPMSFVPGLKKKKLLNDKKILFAITAKEPDQ